MSRLSAKRAGNADVVGKLGKKFNETANPVGDACVAINVKPAESDQVVNGFGPTNKFLFGTLTFANGIWADPNVRLSYNLTATSPDAGFSGYDFEVSGVLLVQATTNSPTNTPAQNADFVYLVDFGIALDTIYARNTGHLDGASADRIREARAAERYRLMGLIDRWVVSSAAQPSPAKSGSRKSGSMPSCPGITSLATSTRKSRSRPAKRNASICARHCCGRRQRSRPRRPGSYPWVGLPIRAWRDLRRRQVDHALQQFADHREVIPLAGILMHQVGQIGVGDVEPLGQQARSFQYWLK